MIPFGVVYLTFSRAAAASSVLGISVTTCLAKFLICISTRFELLRIPIALLTSLIIPFQTLTTDLTRLFTSSDRSPPFSSSKAALTSLEVRCSLSLIIVLSLIILAFVCCHWLSYYLLSFLQPETFDPKKFCWIETGSSTRWILAWF